MRYDETVQYLYEREEIARALRSGARYICEQTLCDRLIIQSPSGITVHEFPDLTAKSASQSEWALSPPTGGAPDSPPSSDRPE